MATGQAFWSSSVGQRFWCRRVCLDRHVTRTKLLIGSCGKALLTMASILIGWTLKADIKDHEGQKVTKIGRIVHHTTFDFCSFIMFLPRDGPGPLRGI